MHCAAPRPVRDGTIPASELLPCFRALTRVVAGGRLSESGWYSAAEAAVVAIYALHPAPQVDRSTFAQRRLRLSICLCGLSSGFDVVSGMVIPLTPLIKAF